MVAADANRTDGEASSSQLGEHVHTYDYGRTDGPSLVTSERGAAITRLCLRTVILCEAVAVRRRRHEGSVPRLGRGVGRGGRLRERGRRARQNAKAV